MLPPLLHSGGFLVLLSTQPSLSPAPAQAALPRAQKAWRGGGEGDENLKLLRSTIKDVADGGEGESQSPEAVPLCLQKC